MVGDREPGEEAGRELVVGTEAKPSERRTPSVDIAGSMRRDPRGSVDSIRKTWLGVRGSSRILGQVPAWDPRETVDFEMGEIHRSIIPGVRRP